MKVFLGKHEFWVFLLDFSKIENPGVELRSRAAIKCGFDYNVFERSSI
jgi:hypothetical protein